MKYLIDFCIKRPLLVNLFTVMVLVVGLLSTYFLQKESFPNVEFDIIVVNTIYPGASPEDVEKLVTISLERKLKSVDGIKVTNAMSYEGFSSIYLELDPDYDIDEVYADTKDAVDSVDDFPDDVKTPTIRKIETKHRSVIRIAINGSDESSRRSVARKLRDRVESLSEVSRVDLSGYNAEEIQIQIDPRKLNQHELTISQVVSAIKDRNISIPGGKIEQKDAELLIRTVSEFVTVDDIADVVIRSNKQGQHVKVKEIAKVVRTFEDNAIFERHNGKAAIYLTVRKRVSADIIKTVDKVKIEVDNFFKVNKFKDIGFDFTDDVSYYVKRRLNVLTSNGVQGLLLVLLCLILFLNFRTALITSLGAPMAFLTAFACMDMLGITINLISLFALILVLGMLVDDSIIVAEQYYKYVEARLSRKEAARRAAMETMQPVLATILTTMVAFGSLFFMGGDYG
jgi:multidrug efflux pump subunit AcrB